MTWEGAHAGAGVQGRERVAMTKCDELTTTPSLPISLCQIWGAGGRVGNEGVRLSLGSTGQVERVFLFSTILLYFKIENALIYFLQK